MTKTVIADCDAGFHHPPGRLDICVPDDLPTPEPVPTNADAGLMFLTLLVVAVAMKVARRK